MKNLIHFIKLAWSVSPAYLVLLVVHAFCETAKNLLNVVLPMYLIDELIGTKDIKQLCLFGGLIVVNNVGMTLVSNTLQLFIRVKEEQTHDGMNKLMSEKIMNLEYSYLENPYYLDLKERAVFTVQNQNVISNLIIAMSELLSRGATLVGLVTILISLGPVL